jgi:hypothetical protein
LHPEDGPAAARESVAAVSVRRAPRYYRFMAVGLVVGVLITLILTFGFPEEQDFNRLQVFGFVGIFVVALCIGLGALVAIVLDRTSRKHARTVSAERIEEHETIAVADFVQVAEGDESPVPAPGAPTPAATEQAASEQAAAAQAVAEPAAGSEPAATDTAASGPAAVAPAAPTTPAPEHDEKA